MLKLLRRKNVTKRIFWVLAVLIIPAFVIWGSASVLNKSKVPNYAGVIFGQRISFDEFQGALYAWKTQLKLQYGDKANEIAKTLLNPLEATWDRLILLHEVHQRHIRVSDNDVVSRLFSLPFLQKNGQFNPQSYKLFLQYDLGLTPHDFEEQLRQNLAMAKVYEQVTQKIFVSDEDVRKEYERQNIKTRIQYILFTPQVYKDKISVTEEELKNYFDQNKETFRVPPKINVAYVRVELKADGSDEEKMNNRKAIERAYAIARRKGFKEAAQETNLEVKETGFFGLEDPVPGLGWTPQLSMILFNMQPPSFSQIIETNNAAYIFKIKDKKEAYLPEFKEAGEKVKDKLTMQKAKAMARQKAEEFLAGIKEKAGFENLAKKENLTIKETSLFAKDGYIPELGMAEALKDAAFSLDKDAVADKIIELEQGFYVIKSKETIPVDEEKFKKEKQDFTSQLLSQRRDKTFEEFFTNLKKRANLTSYIDESNIK